MTGPPQQASLQTGRHRTFPSSRSFHVCVVELVFCYLQLTSFLLMELWYATTCSHQLRGNSSKALFPTPFCYNATLNQLQKECVLKKKKGKKYQQGLLSFRNTAVKRLYFRVLFSLNTHLNFQYFTYKLEFCQLK